MCGPVANGTLPGCKYISCSLKPEIIVFGLHSDFGLGIESIADED